MSGYANRRVAVVGGLGFLGGNLTRRLVADGAALTIVTPARERHEDGVADAERAGVRVVEADVRDRDAMIDLVRGQDVVFNLAGRSGALRSMEDPWADLDVNCGGALSLLEAMRAANPTGKIVFAGSRLEYGRVGAAPVNETHAAEPLCVHAIHKLAIEQYAKLYRHLFGIRYAVARITNPYGPGQPRGRTAYGVVNRMIHLALAGDEVTIYGDGRQRRDYIYVDDAVDALMALGAAPAEGIFNVGTGIGTSIAAMAQAVTEIAGSGRVTFVPWPTLAERIETGDFVADISRIRAEVGWFPTMSLEDGLRRTVAFYRAHVLS